MDVGLAHLTHRFALRVACVSAAAMVTLSLPLGGARAQRTEPPVGSDSATTTTDSASSVRGEAGSAPADSGRREVTTRRASPARPVRRPREPLPVPEWPVKGPDPRPGAILPAKRIVAFYGNPRSRRMGILGEIHPDSMLARLDRVVAEWQKADPATPVQPALHLIAIVAQAHPGRDRKYRARMSDSLVERVASWAARRNALLFLDLQVGTSTVQAELPHFLKFLARPNVHLGLDPEFSMKRGHAPGTRVGTMDATDLNYAVRTLAALVDSLQLPPKILVVHRYTKPMLTNTRKVELDPRVQVVIHMDGWGTPTRKKDSYVNYVYREPVQFTGFKIFYKNDTKRGSRLMTPSEILELEPKPVYIQYQ
jgi:hypothetical protein